MIQFKNRTIQSWTVGFAFTCFFMIFSPQVIAEENQGTAKAASVSTADDSTQDIFLKRNGKKGVSVEFDCSPMSSKSPYCLIHMVDQDNHVICYGLVSNAKVVNPVLSCVPLVQHK